VLASVQAGCAPARAPAAPAQADAAAWHYLPLTEVARLIAARQLSPLDLTEHMLARIGALDGRLHSYFTVSADRARTAARRAEEEIRKGRYRGPLHGVPVAVKDLCLTKGLATTGGMSFLRDNVPLEDATVVARLEAAGAVLLGKLAMTEGAMAGYHRDFPIPVNPWVPDRWTGGSSSGCGVATAAGLCFGSHGSDTGGSIRFPAAANAVVGLKPTYGRVSRCGVMPLAESLDHVGPMTRTVADAAVMLQAIAGRDPMDPTSLDAPVPDYLESLEGGVAGLRIGFDPSQIEGSGTDGYSAALRTALAQLESLGATLIEITLPPIPGPPGQLWFTIGAYEAHQAHRVNYLQRPEAYGEYFRGFLDTGATITRDAYEAARRTVRAFSAEYRLQLAAIDAVAGPATGPIFPITAEVLYGPPSGFDAVIHLFGLPFIFPANLAGVPTICLPCGCSTDGVPFSLQFTAGALREDKLLRIARAYEQATAWHRLHPPV
jgi:amidase